MHPISKNGFFCCIFFYILLLSLGKNMTKVRRKGVRWSTFMVVSLGFRSHVFHLQKPSCHPWLIWFFPPCHKSSWIRMDCEDLWRKASLQTFFFIYIFHFFAIMRSLSSYSTVNDRMFPLFLPHLHLRARAVPFI